MARSPFDFRMSALGSLFGLAAVVVATAATTAGTIGTSAGELALGRAAAGSCLITASGTDGVGHRMEAAITCIAVAAEQNMTYTHTPLAAIEHGEHAAVMERFFGFSKHYPTVDELGLAAMKVTAGATSSQGVAGTGTGAAARARAAPVARNPLPRIGRCREPRWYGTGAKACRQDRSFTVHAAG